MKIELDTKELAREIARELKTATPEEQTVPVWEQRMKEADDEQERRIYARVRAKGAFACRREGKRSYATPMHYHVFFRSQGGTFSAAARAVQSAMTPETSVNLVSAFEQRLPELREAVSNILKSLGNPNFVKWETKGRIDLANGSKIYIEPMKEGCFCGRSLHHLIIDGMPLLTDIGHQEYVRDFLRAVMPAFVMAKYNRGLDVYFSHETTRDFTTGEPDGKKETPEFIGDAIRERVDFGRPLKDGWASLDINRL